MKCLIDSAGAKRTPSGWPSGSDGVFLSGSRLFECCGEKGVRLPGPMRTAFGMKKKKKEAPTKKTQRESKR